MIYDFLNELTKNADDALVESIFDGYFAIFEAALAPTDYSVNEDEDAGYTQLSFTTDMGNKVEIYLTIHVSDDSSIDGDEENIEYDAEVDFSTNGSYTGEGHNDPQILKGVFYAANDYVRKNPHITSLNFYGSEEEVKSDFDVDDKVGKFINTLQRIGRDDNSRDIIGRLKESWGKLKSSNKIDNVNVYLSEIVNGLKRLPMAKLDKDSNEYITKGKDYIISVLDDVKKEVNDYRDNRGSETKRTQAYKTLTRRYFPNVNVQSDGNDVKLSW